MEQSTCLDANSSSLSQKKIRLFCGNLKFITAFTKAGHFSFSWARSIESINPFHTISWRSILILCSHLHISFVSGLLPSGFPIHMLYERPRSHVCYKSRPSHSSWPNHPANIRWGSFLKLHQVFTLSFALFCVAKSAFSVCRLNQRFASKMKLTKSEESGLLSRSRKHAQTQNTFSPRLSVTFLHLASIKEPFITGPHLTVK